ncbi:hypothetical protein [Kitasatospora camelliae]|uniref:Uncharacterized protein n=1 Tax=Kitasatospora camelliae TaxID=3156397 RepID=A0AAU8JMJ1_9ACTN
MTTLDRGGRDRLAALADHLPASPGKGAKTVPVDEELLELAVVLLGQFSAAFLDEPIGRAACTVAERLQVSVPLTAILALEDDTIGEV